MIKFSTTDQAARDNGVKVLVYGKAGIGKTCLCATAPKPLIISIEGGLLSLRKLSVPVVVVENFDDLKKVYKQLLTEKKFAKFETICIDSLSEVGERILSAAKAQVRDQRQAYSALTEEALDLIKKFRDLPNFNVVFTAKETKYIDTVTETVTFGPAMPGSRLGHELPYFFDEVFSMGAKRLNGKANTRFLRTASDLQYEAKDRSGALDEFEKPNLSKIFDKIKKG